MDKKPTKKQAALLDYIEKFSNENNVSPTYREIAAALKLSSVSAVAEHINNCVVAGYLEKVPNAARSLKIIPIQDYKETKTLFRQKIAELNAKLGSKQEEGKTNTLSQDEKLSIQDDIRTLRAAANLLDLNL